MSTTRRRFLRTGLLAALAAALPAKLAFSQNWKEKDGNPNNNPPAQADLLALYSKATFQTYIGSVFQLHTYAGIIPITLMEVDDMPAAKGGECFALEFRGGSLPMKQNTYTLVHASLGTFQLLLVPAGSDQNGAQGYVATMNRLSYQDVLNNPAPGRRDGSIQPSAPTTTVPASTPVASPATQKPSGPTTLPSNPKPKPAGKRKPSWKDFDIQPIELGTDGWL